MTDHSMIVTGVCALFFAGVMFRLARPRAAAESGMMEGYFYVESASYAGTGVGTVSGTVAGRGVTGGVGTDDGVRSGTGAITSRFGSPISAMTRDSEGCASPGLGTPTLWTNEAMGRAILTRFHDTE